MMKIKLAKLLEHNVLSTLEALRVQKMNGLKTIRFAYFLKEFDRQVNPLINELRSVQAANQKEHELMIKEIREQHPDLTENLTQEQIEQTYPEAHKRLQQFSEKFIAEQNEIIENEIEIEELSAELLKELEFTAQQFTGLDATILKH